ncbi:MAG: dTDP-4-dehydrorhamnose 3,5-epimerase [Myxococcota bacterium]|nr:dTDP-4-dehydrorhamnose 3,5-epimerase [Myxococcota bacterium]
MKLIPTKLHDCFVIEAHQFGDSRGFFSPMFEDRKFKERGIVHHFTRINTSLSAQKGTIRGLHYQPPPYQETKLVRVIQGAIWDVALDLRQESPTFGQWTGVRLDSQNRRLFYVPAGCAHGFQTLEPNTEVLYLCSNYYSVEQERGIRWDDPHFSISWPEEASEISQKDQTHPDFEPNIHLW